MNKARAITLFISCFIVLIFILIFVWYHAGYSDGVEMCEVVYDVAVYCNSTLTRCVDSLEDCVGFLEVGGCGG